MLVLTACGSSDERPNPSPSTVSGATTDGKLTIGIAFDQPGLSFKDGDSYSGFDVDTATYVAAALGVPAANITWKEANGDDRQNLLTSGEADLIVSTFSITDDRKKVIDFAGPYFEAHQDLLVRRNEEEITSPETLNGRKLCSVPGTTSAANITAKYQGSDRADRAADVLRLRHGTRRQPGGRGDHRRRDPRRIRGRGSVSRQAEGHRQGFLR